MLLDVEEVGAAEVLVATLVGGLDARYVDVDLDRRLFGYLGDLDVAAELGEAAPDLGQAEMAAHELDGAVGRVDRVRAGRRDVLALMGTGQGLGDRGHVLYLL